MLYYTKWVKKMRYDSTIKYEDKEITIKVPNKMFAQTFELPQFLKLVRDLHGITIQQVHLATDWPTDECQAFEDGTMRIPQDYLREFAYRFKLPAKLKHLGYIQELETRKILGARLKELRIKNELPQIAVACDLGIARSTYACYESCKNEPDLHTLIKIADYYNVSLDYLVGRDIQANDNND